jgi:hypothetical protein
MSFWNRIYTIGVRNNDSELLIRQKKMNNQVTLFTTLATTFFIPYLIVVNNYYYIPFEIATCLLIASAFIFNRLSLLRASMLWRFTIIIADVTFAALEMPDAGFEYFLIPLGLIPFILSNDTKTQLSLLAVAILFFFLRMYFSQHYVPHSSLTVKQSLLTYTIVLTMVFILCALFVIKFKLAGAKYESVIEEQKRVIEEKQKDIIDSITYAGKIQKSLLPTEKYIDKNLTVLQDQKPVKAN